MKKIGYFVLRSVAAVIYFMLGGILSIFGGFYAIALTSGTANNTAMLWCAMMNTFAYALALFVSASFIFLKKTYALPLALFSFFYLFVYYFGMSILVVKTIPFTIWILYQAGTITIVYFIVQKIDEMIVKKLR